MLAAVQGHLAGGEPSPQLCTAVCGAMRRIAVNDEICMEFADAGGVTTTMQASMLEAVKLKTSALCRAHYLTK